MSTPPYSQTQRARKRYILSKKQIRRARGTDLKKNLVCSEKEFLLHDMGEWKGMMGRIFGGFLCCFKRPNYD